MNRCQWCNGIMVNSYDGLDLHCMMCGRSENYGHEKKVKNLSIKKPQYPHLVLTKIGNYKWRKITKEDVINLNPSQIARKYKISMTYARQIRIILRKRWRVE